MRTGEHDPLEGPQRSADATAEKHREERVRLRATHNEEIGNLMARHEGEHKKLDVQQEHERKGGNKRSDREILAE